MKYRKKPVVVDAVQWDGSDNGYAQVIHELQAEALVQHHPASAPYSAPYLTVRTLNGPTTAEAGDWIIRGPRPGDVYPCKPLQFWDVYEAAEDNPHDLNRDPFR